MLIVLGALIALPTTLMIIDMTVSLITSAHCYNNWEDLPRNTIGMIPGTRRLMNNGNINRYYQYRIDGAVKLFKKGKIENIIVSGHRENRPEGLYDEPQEMLEDLVKRGIPESQIITDPSGARTINSINFTLNNSDEPFVIISQKFHNQRAVFIARSMGRTAFGFNVQDVPFRIGLKTRFREIFARMRMIRDLLKKSN